MSEQAASPTPPTPPIRIGHAERAEAVSALDQHLADGRLDADEYGERVAAAHLATTREQLRPLFVDLPRPHPFADEARPHGPAWSPPSRTGDDHPPRSAADYRQMAQRGFGRHPVLATLLIIAITPVLLTTLLVVLAVNLVFVHGCGSRRGWQDRGWVARYPRGWSR